MATAKKKPVKRTRTKKPKPKPAPNPVGRPTKYKPEYCQVIIDLMEYGYTFEACAADLDVSKDTLYEWVKVHEDFSDAKNKAFDKSRKTWETMLISLAKTGMGNATAIIFSLKNRFPKNWRDKIEQETTITVKPLIIEDDEGNTSTYGVETTSEGE